MKKTISLISLLVLLFVTTKGQVAGNFESQNLVKSKNAGITTQFNIYLEEEIPNIDSNLSWVAWGLIKTTWAEAYIGLKWSVVEEFSISFSQGLEIGGARQAISTYAEKYDFSTLSVFEWGHSGYWFKHLFKYNGNKDIGFGVMYQRFVGKGPYAEVKLEKFTVWGSYLFDSNQDHAYLGVKLVF